jgi:hypothetical protein
MAEMSDLPDFTLTCVHMRIQGSQDSEDDVDARAAAYLKLRIRSTNIHSEVTVVALLLQV